MKKKAQYVIWYYETNLLGTVQHRLRNEYGRDVPNVKRFNGWYAKFKKTSSLCDLKRTGKPGVNEDTVDTCIAKLFSRQQKDHMLKCMNKVKKFLS